MIYRIFVLFVSIYFQIVSNALIGQSIWSPYGEINSHVRCLLHDDQTKELYVGGRFKFIDGEEFNGVTMHKDGIFRDLDGGHNQCIGFNCANSFREIFKYENRYIFSQAGWSIGSDSISFEGIAAWDGMSWDSLGGGVPGRIEDFVEYNDNLLFSGVFSYVGSTPANSVAGWNGSEFFDLGFPYDPNPNDFPTVLDMLVQDDRLYVAGSFDDAADNGIDAAVYENGTWSQLGNGIMGLNDNLSTLTFYEGELYAGGTPKKSNGNAGNALMKLENEEWVEVGDFFSEGDFIRILRVHQGLLWMIGNFELTVDGNTYIDIAAWNGSTWCGNTEDIYNSVLDVAFTDSLLIIGGAFRLIEHDSIRHLAATSLSNFDCGAPSAVDEAIPPSDPQILVYPNPANENFVRVDFSEADFAMPPNLELFSARGQKISVGMVQESDNLLRIDLPEQQYGVFYLSVQSGNRASVHKVVRLR